MREDEEDLYIADLDSDRQRYTATDLESTGRNLSNYVDLLERETGIEPATLKLGKFPRESRNCLWLLTKSKNVGQVKVDSLIER